MLSSPLPTVSLTLFPSACFCHIFSLGLSTSTSSCQFQEMHCSLLGSEVSAFGLVVFFLFLFSFFSLFFIICNFYRLLYGKRSSSVHTELFTRFSLGVVLWLYASWYTLPVFADMYLNEWIAREIGCKAALFIALLLCVRTVRGCKCVRVCVNSCCTRAHEHMYTQLSSLKASIVILS